MKFSGSIEHFDLKKQKLQLETPPPHRAERADLSDRADQAERADLSDRADRVKRADPCDRAARADRAER